MKISNDDLVKKHDFLNISFNHGESILKSNIIFINTFLDVNLKDINYYHHQFSKKEPANYVGFGVKFENMRKILLIRSPYVINNKTETDY